MYSVITQREEISQFKVIKENMQSSKKEFNALKLIINSNCSAASMSGILLSSIYVILMMLYGHRQCLNSRHCPLL
jgi:hypothetical protein